MIITHEQDQNGISFYLKVQMVQTKIYLYLSLPVYGGQVENSETSEISKISEIF